MFEWKIEIVTKKSARVVKMPPKFSTAAEVNDFATLATFSSSVQATATSTHRSLRQDFCSVQFGPNQQKEVFYVEEIQNKLNVLTVHLW